MVRVVRQESITAYALLQQNEGKPKQEKLGHREQEVLEAYDKHPCSTDLEITYILHFTDPNKVRPRRKALKDYGFLEDAGAKTDPTTGKTVRCWKTTDAGKWQLFFYGRRTKVGNA